MCDGPTQFLGVQLLETNGPTWSGPMVRKACSNHGWRRTINIDHRTAIPSIHNFPLSSKYFAIVFGKMKKLSLGAPHLFPSTWTPHLTRFDCCLESGGTPPRTWARIPIQHNHLDANAPPPQPVTLRPNRSLSRSFHRRIRFPSHLNSRI